MVQVLQDVADMAVNFERSQGVKPSAREAQQSTLKADKLKCWHCQGNHLKRTAPPLPKNSSLQSKPHISKAKQCNFIKSFCKRFQDKKSQVNEITTTSEDDSLNDQLNQFFAEFENLMSEDADNMSS